MEGPSIYPLLPVSAADEKWFFQRGAGGYSVVSDMEQLMGSLNRAIAIYLFSSAPSCLWIPHSFICSKALSSDITVSTSYYAEASSHALVRPDL